MPVNDHVWNFEIAERLRLDAARVCEPDKRRLLNLARMYDINAELVRGSQTAITESREAICRANRLLGR